MSSKRLTVITEGGTKFGFGHITRCLSITNIFKKHEYIINFIIHGDESVTGILDDTSHTVFDWLEDFDTLLEQFGDSSIILLDSMEISNEQIKKLELLEIPIIFIDDEKRRNILDSGFVVDWTVLSDTKNYFNPQKEDVTYLLGSKFTPLREAFSIVSQNSIRDDVCDILITFGGADVQNLTPSILKTIVNNFPNINKHIVIGSGFTNIQSIEEYKDENTHLIFDADTKTMIELMQKCDIAVASGGQTLYELARIGTPTIAILLVENAKDDTQGWEKVGSLKNIGWHHDKELLSRLVSSLTILKNKELRVEMQNKAKEYIAPNGAVALVDAILGKLK